MWTLRARVAQRSFKVLTEFVAGPLIAFESRENIDLYLLYAPDMTDFLFDFLCDVLFVKQRGFHRNKYNARLDRNVFSGQDDLHSGFEEIILQNALRSIRCLKAWESTASKIRLTASSTVMHPMWRVMS